MSQLNYGYSMTPMNLHQIAIEAMRSRGLLPAFAPQALQEAGNARPADSQAGQAGHGDMADLHQLTWFSIDNDDTRDLDQLSVAAMLGFLLLCLGMIGWIVRTGWKRKT